MTAKRSRWLAWARTGFELLALLKPCPDEWLNIYPVDRKVANVMNKDADMILPIKLQQVVPEKQISKSWNMLGVALR